MPGRALVIGEALVDMIGAPEADGGIVYRPRSGGSPLNVAVGLARLGTDVTFATAIAGDSFGRRLHDFLAGEGVDVISMRVDNGGTCLAMVTRIGRHVDFEYFGDADAMLAINPIDRALVQAASVVHAGSTAFLGEPVRSSVATAYVQVGPFRTADPNPRPFLIEDRERYLLRLEEVVALADLVKLSQEDLDYLYAGISVEAVVDRWLRLGPTIVIITRAEEDTVVATADGLRSVAVPSTNAVDPTGAGDSFTASLLRDICADGVPDGLDGWERLTWRADVAASLTCASLGGAESMPTSDEFNARLEGLDSARIS